MSDLQELKPNEVMLGNFIDSMGNVEMITEIVMQTKGSWFIGHNAWGMKSNPIPDGVQYAPYPIPLTDKWKECLGIEKYEGLPEHIKYVHEAQNWFFWHLGVNLHENIKWSEIPR